MLPSSAQDLSGVTLAGEESAFDFTDVPLAFDESAFKLLDVTLAQEDDRPRVPDHTEDSSSPIRLVFEK